MLSSQLGRTTRPHPARHRRPSCGPALRSRRGCRGPARERRSASSGSASTSRTNTARFSDNTRCSRVREIARSTTGPEVAAARMSVPSELQQQGSRGGQRLDGPLGRGSIAPPAAIHNGRVDRRAPREAASGLGCGRRASISMVVAHRRRRLQGWAALASTSNPSVVLPTVSAALRSSSSPPTSVRRCPSARVQTGLTPVILDDSDRLRRPARRSGDGGRPLGRRA